VDNFEEDEKATGGEEMWHDVFVGEDASSIILLISEGWMLMMVMDGAVMC